MDNQDWRAAEHERAQMTTKERGQLMLWALLNGCPVSVYNSSARREFGYKCLTEVRFLPAAPGLSVRAVDDHDRAECPKGLNVRVPSAPEQLPNMWDKVDLTAERREELLDAMRKGYTVVHGDTEYCRITTMFFVRDPSGDRITVELAMLDSDDRTTEYRCPQAAVTVTGHQLNR